MLLAGAAFLVVRRSKAQQEESAGGSEYVEYVPPSHQPPATTGRLRAADPSVTLSGLGRRYDLHEPASAVAKHDEL